MSASSENEKYDKIRRQSERSRVRCFISLVVLAMLAGAWIFMHEGASWTSDTTPVAQTNSVVVSIEDLESRFRQLDLQVREIKKTGVIMETDPHSLEATKALQEAARNMIKARYGDLKGIPYRVRVDLEFTPSHADYTEENKYATLLLELAPISIIPYSVFTFLEMARGYRTGGFHRNAPHVLQADLQTKYIKQPLAFQEYSDEYQHKKGTTGFCGRPSSVCWYVSIQDNTKNHGPGSQQDKNPYEADALFGKVIEGMDDVVPRIHRVMKPTGFLPNRNEWVLVNQMHILVPDGHGGYREWMDKDEAKSS